VGNRSERRCRPLSTGGRRRHPRQRPQKRHVTNRRPSHPPLPLQSRPHARSEAFAIADAAKLVRDPDYRDNHCWILRSGDTVLGQVEPSYGGASISGRNGWISRLSGTPGCRSRDGAAMDLASHWVRVVTTPSKRTLTGDYAVSPGSPCGREEDAREVESGSG
jgi:hypothetical protein